MPERPIYVVTGSTSGIGRATARQLAADGAEVVVVGRTRERIEAAVAELGSAASGVVADLLCPDGIAALADALGDRPLDGLVLSHGGDQVPTIFATSDPTGFDYLVEAMFLTNARLCHRLLPSLAAGPGRAEGGRILIVTSDAGRAPTVGEVMIGALAAANLMFVRTLSREVARQRIRVHAVGVSLTEDTESYDRVMGASDFSRRLFGKAAARMPFGPVRAADVAATVVHLLGPDSAATGQVVSVNGGLTT